MKKSYIYKGIAALAVAFSMTACDFLDKEPSNELTGQQVFSDWVTMEQFHFDTYNFLLNGECRINGSWLDAATDLAETSVSNSGTRTSFNIGNYYAAGGAAELTSPWESRFRAIRKCNMLLERIETVPQPTDIDQATYEKRKGYYKGEAMALRAWFYWELFLRYGTVPIIKEVLNPDGDLLSNYSTRPSLAEFKNFLISDLDAAYPLVMDKGTSYESGNEGRVNQPVVMALKSRILLYMASPRYAAESGVTWQQAADAAKEFIDNYGTSYKLADTYENAILRNAHNEANPEVIFYRNDVAQGWGSYGYYIDVPVGEGGNGGACPSQNLIDMYDMANGVSPFTDYDATGAPVYTSTATCPDIRTGSYYDDSRPNGGRDPRLAATVLTHGTAWNGRTLNIIRGGDDNPIGNANATPTGYYLRKYMPEAILMNNHSGVSYRNWILIRYAEILLNYAEALNEVDYTGNRTTINNLLDEVRHRGGITGNMSSRTDLDSQEKMRNFIHKERTVELAFEEHRWWDVRRWGVAREALSRDIIGMDIAHNGRYSRKVAQKRVFEDRMYLYPIPEGEYWKTGFQNPNW